MLRKIWDQIPWSSGSMRYVGVVQETARSSWVHIFPNDYYEIVESERHKVEHGSLITCSIDEHAMAFRIGARSTKKQLRKVQRDWGQPLTIDLAIAAVNERRLEVKLIQKRLRERLERDGKVSPATEPLKRASLK